MPIQNEYLILDCPPQITVQDVYTCLDGLAPFSTAESYDNVGLLIGDKHHSAEKLLLCLDITEQIVNFAALNGVDCIVSHHPLMFKPIGKINDDYFDYKIITKLIKKDICVIAAHTNYDLCRINNSIKSLEVIGGGTIAESIYSEYGAVLSLDIPTAFEKILNTVKANFGNNSVRGYKNNAKDATKIGYYAGSLGHNTEIILQCVNECDILISSEFKYGNLLIAEKTGVSIIDIEHNQSEKVFVSNVFNYIKESLCENIK